MPSNTFLRPWLLLLALGACLDPLFDPFADVEFMDCCKVGKVSTCGCQGAQCFAVVSVACAENTCTLPGYPCPFFAPGDGGMPADSGIIVEDAGVFMPDGGLPGDAGFVVDAGLPTRYEFCCNAERRVGTCACPQGVCSSPPFKRCPEGACVLQGSRERCF